MIFSLLSFSLVTLKSIAHILSKNAKDCNPTISLNNKLFKTNFSKLYKISMESRS